MSVEMTHFIRIVGSIIVLYGFGALGLKLGSGMTKRIHELREMERIIEMLEGELKYRRNPLPQCFLNVGLRSSKVFGKWLIQIGEEVKDGQTSFGDIWVSNINELKIKKYNGKVHLDTEDIDELNQIGQALSEENVDSQLAALELERMTIHNLITRLTSEINNKKKAVISSCGLGGIICVILLAI